MLCGQNVIGQNVTDKMSRTKCREQNVVVKISWSKCRGQNVGDKMSGKKCRGQYVLVKMFWSRCPGYCRALNELIRATAVVLTQISQSLSCVSRLPTIFQNIVELNCYLERESFTRNNEACLHSFVETGEATKWGVRCCMTICMFARVSARNAQDRTVEQMWNSSVPHFPDFKIHSL